MPKHKVPEVCEPTVVEEATICCGFKRCPHVIVYSDGSILVTDQDQASPSGLSFKRIEFNPEQAKALQAMLDRSLPR